ncbi:plasmid maintenance protein (plasmid) [Borrelia miyamotoi]|uniref:Plasmid maintenance protein n=2 Tax=Borrelia miyamotoi TaxID=47466 RepID=A0A481YI24_9SPIR|nr:plasmid maintenance protein [Borrelia miyamotoi]AHH05510.1 Hypothetical protein BOM_0967 [Borrelia miyamotoi FR64b]QBK63944.1 hypothetical protein EZU68_06090 [Borrelia miyamotoi]QBK65230.1 hypothetical protein EZU69_06060 [Borrelia miyamotoi]QBK66445.1 hypothetical protein EZU70_05835 [Borrelia miyamotoi]QBL99396.1 hypothetical protein EZU71_06010 [Borrelia miyamotoi]
MRSIKKTINKYQNKLIVLISTLNYMNTTFEQYTQNDILHYFNGNMKRNGQKPIKLKTLQNYLYKLEKIFKVTNNYHRHLGVNMGTEIYYSLKYTKKECYRIINKHFRDKKKNRYKNRVNDYLKKTCVKNGSVEKWECSYNIYNNKKEEENKKSIEKLQVEKYAKKCDFKSKTFLSIFNLKAEKNVMIEMLKVVKRTENFFVNNNKNGKIDGIKPKKSKLESKQQELSRILYETKISLKNEGYDIKQLEIQIQKIYEQYKHKPHFVIENNKYNDLRNIIAKLKKSVEYVKKSTRDDEKNIRNNIFSILLEQLRHKLDIEVLAPILKKYLDKQNKLEYKKVFNNQYYHELLELVKNKENYLRLGECAKLVT